MKQKTINKKVSFSGIGLHSGKKVTANLYPAYANTGVVFKYKDKTIKLKSCKVKETQLCTGIFEDGISINTIEHFMFSLFYKNIDNIIIELNEPEMPILDGSSIGFILALEEAGIKELPAYKKFLKLKNNIEIKIDDKFIKAKPSNLLNINLEIDFEHHIIGNQKIDLNYNNFHSVLRKASRARTFGFIKDIEYLRNKNLVLGGSIDNAIVLDDYKILNPDGLRFNEEFVYHKLLDFIGDIYVEGYFILADIEAFKSGHYLNNLFLNKILSNPLNYEIITFEEENFDFSLDKIFSFS